MTTVRLKTVVMDANVITRVEAVITQSGLSQAKFAKKCGIEPPNLNKRLQGAVGFTDTYLMRIAKAMGVNFDWLRDGVGEMFEEDSAISDAQYKETQDMLRETGSGPESDVALLQHRVEMLELLLEEKEKQIKDKDDHIKTLNGILSQMVHK